MTVLVETLTHQEFFELCNNKSCELEGVVLWNDTVWDSFRGIQNRQFYNENEETIDILFREYFDLNDNVVYDIYCQEGDY